MLLKYMENSVLKSIEPVIERSRYVRVNKDKIRDFAESFSPAELRHWLQDSPFDISSLSNEEKLAFLFVFNSISFSYWNKHGEEKWTVEYKGQMHDGAML